MLGKLRTLTIHSDTNIQRRGIGVNEPTDKPWAHDLHDEHEMEIKQAQFLSKQIQVASATQKEHDKASFTSTAPNRSFSFTAVVGNVNVQISLPGMVEKVSVPNFVKKHRTLLPQHRPPLRRDKPVRISIPDLAPRYIFPSTERSFIFIPRALRPNQQTYTRGRGRGSFHGSRRPSIYGSGYTPSVDMSRKSSIGASTLRDGIRSPADSVMSRHMAPGAEANRPVVRMPSVGPTPAFIPTGILTMNGQVSYHNMPASQTHPAAIYGSHSTAIPMHQPRPQKAVSVADIETPASFQFKAPQQQLEHPFHQQVPTHITNSYGEDKPASQPPQPTVSGMPGASLLSQIPEGAVFTPGFQPFPNIGGPSYFGLPYNNGAIFYPPMPDARPLAFPMGGPAMAPTFVPGSQSHPVNHIAPTEPVEGVNMMAHESNGMVYYYNPASYPTGVQGSMQHFSMPPSRNIAPLGNGVPPQAPFYYPPVPAAMFYPTQSG